VFLREQYRFAKFQTLGKAKKGKCLTKFYGSLIKISRQNINLSEPETKTDVEAGKGKVPLGGVYSTAAVSAYVL
jgi:hypothetical protein